MKCAVLVPVILLAACAARRPISAEVVAGDVAKSSSEILGCAKKNVADLPKDRCVTYRLRILPTGSIDSVSMMTPRVGKGFTQCLDGALRTLRFAEYEIPKPSFQFAQVLNFSGKEGACPKAPPKLD